MPPQQQEIFKNIMDQAQQYAGQVRSEMSPIPQAPTISQDVSQFDRIQNVVAQGTRDKGMVSGGEQRANYEYDWQEKLKQQAAEAAARAYSQKKEDEASNKPVRVPKSDGGFDFFDGKGNPISAYDFARANDSDIASVLKDSMNPEDQKFVRDYEGLRQFWDSAQALESQGKVDVDKWKTERAKDEDGNEVDVLMDENGKQVTDENKLTYYSWLRDNPEMKNMTLDKTRNMFMKKWSNAYFVPQGYKAPYNVSGYLE